MDDHVKQIQRFLAWESRVSRVGTLGPKNKDDAKYIPKSLHDAYFQSHQTVKNILDELLPTDHPNAYYVWCHYRWGFTILLSIGQGRMIGQFAEHPSLQDKHLPFPEQPPTGFPNGSDGNLFESFYERQWRYFPQELNYGMQGPIPSQVILPFRIIENLGRGVSADVNQIVVDDDYDHLGLPARNGREATRSIGPTASSTLQADHSAQKHFFALKTFRGKDAEKHFRTEKQAFEKLNQNLNSPAYIVCYHGSFIRHQTYNLILEYADQGTLYDFMFIEKVPPPSRGEDTIMLWKHLSKLLLGLQSLHEAGDEESSSQFMSGWHQDVKPRNILVKSRPGAKSLYDVKFILADFGLSHFKLSDSSQKDLTDQDTYGTHAYGAPETYRINRDVALVPHKVHRNVDIWSLGCIFSEVATWIGHGLPRVEQYRHERQVEAAKKLNDPGVGDLFHDGEKVLDAVEHCHNSFQDSRRVDDFITPKIVKDVISEMLESQRVRPNTFQAYSRAEKAIRAASKELEDFREPPVPTGINSASGDSFQPIQPRTQPLPQQRQIGIFENGFPRHVHVVEVGKNTPRPNLGQVSNNDEPPPRTSVEEILKWKRDRKFGTNTRLPDDELLSAINARDLVFVVDNTDSMIEHKAALREVLEAIVYTVKNYDPNGVDLLFTHSNRKVSSTKKTTIILDEFDKVTFKGKTDMQLHLNNILDIYKRRMTNQQKSWRSWIPCLSSRESPRKLSLYILTDGRWHPGCDVESVIKSMVAFLVKHDLRNAQVAIQFIRFGPGTPGIIKQLDHLDDGLGLELDIVDTTPSGGNVWKMILGAIHTWFDKDNQPPTPLA